MNVSVREVKARKGVESCPDHCDSVVLFFTGVKFLRFVRI